MRVPSLPRLPLVLGMLALPPLAVTFVARAADRPSFAATVADTGGPPDAWLKGLTGAHRQLFDTPAPDGGIPLVHVMNYYDTYNRAYGVRDADIDAVITFYGGTTLYAVNDAAWAKYRIGEFLETTDPATGARAVANPWRASPVIMGGPMPAASVEALQRRGATFIACDNAMTIFATRLAKARGLDAATVHADLKANLLPGVELVPAMVIAIEQAQRAGASYHRQ